MLTVFISLVMLTGITLAIVYNTKYRNHPWDIYYPKLAWMRGGMYFCACYTLSYFTGAMELILTSPIVTAAQLDNPNWIWFTIGITAFIVGAYSILWGASRGQTPIGC
jgi:steroid 5-alpha reductase family enzyme